MPETHTIKVTVYDINELSDKARENALNRLSESQSEIYNPLDLYSINEIAEKKGLKFNAIYWNSYPWYNTGGDVDVMDVKKLLKAVNLDLRTKAAREIIENGVIIKTVRESFNSDAGYSTDDETLKMIQETEVKIDTLISSLADDYVKQVREDYEYVTGEEYLTEMCADMGYKFLENGRIWNGTP